MTEHAGSAESVMESLALRIRLPLLNYFRRRVRCNEDAEELTQEVFLRLVRRGELRDVRHVEGFAFATAANLLKDYYRGASRQGEMQPFDKAAVALISPEPQPDQITDDRQQVEALLAAIKTLPPRCRTVFIMHRFDNVAHTEIAKQLRISVSAVEKHIANAVMILRKKLERGPHD